MPSKNHERADRVAAFVKSYDKKMDECDTATNVADIIADLLHFAHLQGEDTDKISGRALGNFRAEKKDPEGGEGKMRAACEAKGWREGGGYIYDSAVYGSWKEAVSLSGDDEKDSPVYDSWLECYTDEVKPHLSSDANA